MNHDINIIKHRLQSSFRDPAGFVFIGDDNLIRRYITPQSYVDLDLLGNSGLYTNLINERLLVPHELVETNANYRILLPEQIPFISYPYEWSFQQLKAAALTTLRIQELALSHGMTLKDASAYNIQWRGCEPVLIDTLSFEKSIENNPWKAYRQFCKHFLAPLLLMADNSELAGLWLSQIDGFPLKLTSRLLPLSSWFSFGVLAHIHLHAALEENPKKASTTNKHHQLKSSLKSQTALVQALKSLVKKLRIKNKTTHWSNYYADNTYTHEDFTRKKQFVLEAIDQVHPNTIWDFGANTGFFSLSVAPLVKNVISLEYDTNCVDTMYDRAIAKGTTNLLPLKQDLLNPSPAVGWGNCERQSLVQRGPCDLGMALAIIHHLALGGNVPLEMIAHSLAKMCKKLIIEFVHPEDIRASQLLERKPSLRERYSIQEFQKAFNLHFYVLKNISLNSRELYLLERH